MGVRDLVIVHAIWGMPKTSGVSMFCVEIANEQARHGHNVIILNDHDDRFPIAPLVRRVTAPSMDAIDVLPDVVHVHAVWSMFSVRVMRWCRQHKVPYVVSPHGGLMPRVFTIKRVRKFLFWHLLLRPLLNRAKAIHCTSDLEAQACRERGVTSPCFIAPLGVRMPALAIDKLENPIKRPYVLFLGRLGQEKGLETLLDAWKTIKCSLKASAEFALVLAGPDWCGYKTVLEAKISAEKIPDVIFYGAVEGAAKDGLYRFAQSFVLPSPMENFSMVVLEALAYGVPTIASRGTPWAIIEKIKAGFWVNADIEGLSRALEKMMTLDLSSRDEMSRRAIEIAKSKYSWRTISETVLSRY